MLIYLNDKSLNKFMPLKRLAPYREEIGKQNKFLQKKKLGDLARELDRKKKEIISTQTTSDDIVQNNKKFFTKKTHKVKVDDNKKEFKKKKRLESYGITD